MALFALAFVAGALLFFMLPLGVGYLLWPPGEQERAHGVAAVGVLFWLLGGVDLTAMARATYCPLGWRRQTPKWLLRRWPWPLVATIWGFDTGLFFTTFRVAAVGWGAVILVAMHPEVATFAGLGYGLGFALPFLALVTAWRLGIVRDQGEMPRRVLESMLAQRRRLQTASAIMLWVTGAGMLSVTNAL